MRALDRTEGMPLEEILARLRDRMSQETAVIRKSFLKYDARKKGKVSKKDFRKVG